MNNCLLGKPFLEPWQQPQRILLLMLIPVHMSSRHSACYLSQMKLWGLLDVYLTLVLVTLTSWHCQKFSYCKKQNKTAFLEYLSFTNSRTRRLINCLLSFISRLSRGINHKIPSVFVRSILCELPKLEGRMCYCNNSQNYNPTTRNIDVCHILHCKIVILKISFSLI